MITIFPSVKKCTPIFWLLLIGLCGCSGSMSNSPKSNMQYFSLEDTDLRINLSASDPFINAPVAMDIDTKGRIWVLEMPDYMPDIDGAEEDIPQGRVVILTDNDDDGYHEEAQVFLDSLHHPRAISLVYGGLLYATPPNLWFVDIIDDQPGTPVLVDSLYAIGGNIEHQPNGLLLNIDNWIYSAKSQNRYRRIDQKWLKEPTSFRGQWGISNDQYGRLYYNDNSNGLYGDLLIPNTIINNKHITDPKGITNNLLKDRSIRPAHSTSVNRGYLDYMLDSNDIVKTMTSTCGPLIYEAEELGSDYKNNGFICVPEGNLIKRVTVTNNFTKQDATNTYKDTEWLRSTDEGFRPVNLFHALDGSIYIVDMHRGIIQHNIYMTDYLRSQILEKGLDTIHGQGRIYKVHNPTNETAPVDLSSMDSKELITLLDHSNILIRNKAQEYLIHQAEPNTSELLYTQLNSFSEIGKIHSLYTLEGIDQLDWQQVSNFISAEHTQLISHILSLLWQNTDKENELIALQIIKTISPIDPNNLYIGYALGRITLPQHQEERKKLYHTFIENNKSSTAAQMVLAGAPINDHMAHNILEKSSSKHHTKQVRRIKEAIAHNTVNPIFEKKDPSIYDNPSGRDLYVTLCATCHNSNGRGMANLAPSLKNSKILEGHPAGIAATILNGLQGPITVNGDIENYTATMPGIKLNKQLTDQKIADIINFATNSFRSIPSKITGQEISVIRNKLNKYDQPLTEEEVMTDFQK